MEFLTTLALLTSTYTTNILNGLTQPQVAPTPRTLGVTTPSRPTHPSNFYEPQFIEPALLQHPATAPQPIKGGIIPHHLMASDLIADYFSQLSQETSTIILIGPNHYQLGDTPVLTSDWDWDTPYGITQANTHLINRLTDQKYISSEPNVLTHEHSVAGIMPFIAYYLPNTQVVPLIINPDISTEDIHSIVNILASYPDTHIIASVDFSHYLNAAHAQQNDQYTQDLLLTNNWRGLLPLQSDYTDSPQSLAILIQLMEHHQATPTIIQNTNSGFLKNDPISETTSYFEVIYKAR